MNPTSSEILNAAMSLSREERLDLIEALVESVEPMVELPFHESWVEVARRRAEEVDSGKVQGIPWSEVLRRAREATGE